MTTERPLTAMNAVVATIGDALPELYCFVSTTRPLNVAS